MPYGFLYFTHLVTYSDMITKDPYNRNIGNLGLSHDGKEAIFEYQSLERRVRELILKICGPFCSTCSDCCCKKDYCSESLDSYWLELTWGMWGYNRAQYDEYKGWLLSDGCRLVTGRPPVCYEYLCQKILSDVQGTYLDMLKEISMLLSYAGKNALGDRHLITLSSKQVLTRMNFSKLRRKLNKSQTLLQGYEREIRPLLSG